MPIETPTRQTEWKSVEQALTHLTAVSEAIRTKANLLERRLLSQGPPQPVEGISPESPKDPPLLQFVETCTRKNLTALAEAADILSRLLQELT